LAYAESGLVVTPWPPKRDFGGTPLSTEWFSRLSTKVGLPSVRWPLWKKVVVTYFDYIGVGIYTPLHTRVGTHMHTVQYTQTG